MTSIPIQNDLTRDIANEIVLSDSLRAVWSADLLAAIPTGFTFARSTAAGCYDSAGNWVITAAGMPRFDYHPTTHAALGLLSEESRTNYLLQSFAPATQTVSLTTGTYVLSVSGAGSCTCAAGTAVGRDFAAAVAGTPVTFVLTTAGTVVFTVGGVLTRFQCEKGAAPTSFIQTTTAAATRSGDVCTGPAPAINPVEGTFVVQATVGHSIGTVFGLDDGAGSDAMRLQVTALPTARGYAVNINGVALVNDSVSAALAVGTPLKIAVTYGPGGALMYINGALATTNTAVCTGLVVSALRIGNRYQPTAGRNLNGCVSRIGYYAKALPAQKLVELTV